MLAKLFNVFKKKPEYNVTLKKFLREAKHFKCMITYNGDTNCVFAARSIVHVNNKLRPSDIAQHNGRCSVFGNSYYFVWKSVCAFMEQSMLKAENFSMKKVALFILESELTEDELATILIFVDEAKEQNIELEIRSYPETIEVLRYHIGKDYGVTMN